MEQGTIDFLNHLWQDRPLTGKWYGEIRNISRGGSSPTQDFYTLELDGRIGTRWARNGTTIEDNTRHANNVGYDVYFGVMPRTKTDGKGESVPPATRILWADFDDKAFVWGNGLRAMNSLPVPPDIIVDTGGGVHAYWTLSAHIPVDTAETIMRGIAKRHKADHCWDRSRIMRLPGTVNWKYSQEGAEPVRARILKADYVTTHSPSAFVEYIYEMTKPVVLPRMGATLSERFHPSLPGWLQNLIEDGVPKGQRSEQAFKVVCNLVERGWRYAQIQEVFEDNPRGIGEKYHERNMGDRWLQLTYAAALTSIGK